MKSFGSKEESRCTVHVDKNAKDHNHKPLDWRSWDPDKNLITISGVTQGPETRKACNLALFLVGWLL